MQRRVQGLCMLLSLVCGGACAFLAWPHLSSVWIRNAGKALLLVGGLLGIGILLRTLVLNFLHQLARRSLTMFVALRHLQSPKSGFLNVLSLLSVGGVAVSSCALSAVISLMTGLSHDMKKKIADNTADMVIDMPTQPRGWSGFEATRQKVQTLAGVEAVTPVLQEESMLVSVSTSSGVLVRGVELESVERVLPLASRVEIGSWNALAHPEQLLHLPAETQIGVGPNGEHFLHHDEEEPPASGEPPARHVLPGIVVGRELSRTLHAYVGDEVTLVSPLGDLGPMGILPRARTLRIAGIFYTGIYEIDASVVYMRLADAQKHFGAPGQITSLEVKLSHTVPSEEMQAQARAALPAGEGRVRLWQEIHSSLFAALSLERIVMFATLSLSLIVASFCVLCTLLLRVMEKEGEIAVFKALGATPRTLRQIFLLEGFLLGSMGTALGLLSGFGLCLGLKTFGMRLDPEVSYLEALPVHLDPLDFASVALASLLICLLAPLYPARASAKVSPVEALRGF